ncbi:hypothetical protein BDF22DRAFT_745787 [Syncephalis plumigaleata]|nr:hypothetical protein BDF22DRAFT_745787 [Syncephalis plumigaleata]
MRYLIIALCLILCFYQGTKAIRTSIDTSNGGSGNALGPKIKEIRRFWVPKAFYRLCTTTGEQCANCLWTIKTNACFNCMSEQRGEALQPQLVKATSELRGTALDGSEFIDLPLLAFEHDQRYCYVMPTRCPKSLTNFMLSELIQDRAKALYKLFIQLLRAIAFMHRAQLLMSYFNPEDICVTSGILSKPRIHLRTFTNSVLLSVIDNMNNTMDNPYLKAELKKQDSFSIGKAIYKTVSNSTLPEYYNSNHGPMDNFYYDVIKITPFKPSFGVCEQSLQPLVRMINTLVAHDFSNRPTPEEYLNGQIPPTN